MDKYNGKKIALTAITINFLTLMAMIDRNNIYEGYALVTIDGAHVSMEWRYYDPVSETFKSRSGFTYTQQ
jgi:hypothetical protein